MGIGNPGWKDINEIYEDGKHRRYGLLFAVNGAAFAIGKFLVGEGNVKGVVLGGMNVTILALAMIVFSTIMCYDIHKFGQRMKALDPDLYKEAGRSVLVCFWLLLAVGWFVVGFVPPPE